MAGLVAVPRRGGVARPDPVVRAQGHRRDLRLHPGSRDPAADALRPAHELRLEVPDPLRSVLGARDRSDRGAPGSLRTSARSVHRDRAHRGGMARDEPGETAPRGTPRADAGGRGGMSGTPPSPADRPIAAWWA